MSKPRARAFYSQKAYRQRDSQRILVACGLLSTAIFGGFAFFFLVLSSSSTAAVIPADKVSPPDRPSLQMVDVVVSARDLRAGERIFDKDLHSEKRPSVSVTSPSLSSVSQAQGLYTKVAIRAGTPISLALISDKRPTNDMTGSIPDGYRAVTISVDARSSVEGWVRPDAQVDVVWISNTHGQPTANIIVENAKILAAERRTRTDVQDLSADLGVPSTVTLLVTAEDSTRIQLATTSGSLTLSLRGDGDSKSSGRSAIKLTDLYSKGAAPAPEKRSAGKIRIMGSDGKYQDFSLVDGKLTP